MANELKATVINMKSLNQNILDPVIVGAGDANGRTLRVIFTQEAAAQMTPETKVYLSWHHQEVDIKGYNVFTKIENEEDESAPPTWEITYPKSMLYEGNVLACIQIVDKISIATSTNFTIHVLIDPNDGSRYIATDDFSDFQKAVINMTALSDEMKRQLANQKIEFEDMQLEFMDVRRVALEAEAMVQTAQSIADEALQTSQNALNTIVDFRDIASEAKDIAQEAQENVAQANESIQQLSNRMDTNEQITEAIREVANSAKEIAEAIQDSECCGGGVSEEELAAAIQQAKQEILEHTNQEIIGGFTITEF